MTYECATKAPVSRWPMAGARLQRAPGYATATERPVPPSSRRRCRLRAAHGRRSSLLRRHELGDPSADQLLDQSAFAGAIECGFVGSRRRAPRSRPCGALLPRAQRVPVRSSLSAPVDVQHLDADPDDEYTPSTALFSTVPNYPNPTSIARGGDHPPPRPPPDHRRRARRSASGAESSRSASENRSARSSRLRCSRELAAWRDGVHAGSRAVSSRTTIELAQDADCVIAIGASLNHYTIEYGYTIRTRRSSTSTPRRKSSWVMVVSRTARPIAMPHRSRKRSSPSSMSDVQRTGLSHPRGERTPQSAPSRYEGLRRRPRHTGPREVSLV